MLSSPGIASRQEGESATGVKSEAILPENVEAPGVGKISGALGPRI